MKAKYPGTCKKTGRRFEKGDEIKWLGKGKGAELISYADRNEYVPAHKKTWDGNPFNESPNHGWLVVPLTEAHAFEFKEGTEFSRFSFQDESYAYLEEDLDMYRFLKERGEEGVDYVIREVQTESTPCFGKRWETGKYIWSKET